MAFYNSSVVAYEKYADKESFKKGQSDGNLFSANYLIKFQRQFKPLNQELLSVLSWRITNCCNSGLQSVLDVGLQSVAKWITKYIRNQKVQQADYKVHQGSQSQSVD